MVSAAETNNIKNISLLLFFSCFFWIIAYDTAYALCDKKHDLNLGINIFSNLPKDRKFDVLILAVKHDKFSKLAPLDFITKKGFVYDIKRLFKPHPKIYSL